MRAKKRTLGRKTKIRSPRPPANASATQRIHAEFSSYGEPTIGTRLKTFFPDGTIPAVRGWSTCPLWPPDLFAFAGSLVQDSGCYADLSFAGLHFDDAYRVETTNAGTAWRNEVTPPSAVQQWWSALRSVAGSPLRPSSLADRPSWWLIALKLLAAADEASGGIGFADFGRSTFSDFFALEHEKVMKGTLKELTLRHLPLSLCIAVPPGVACVQPKTRTPQVGCTLRALSHNLALLPPVGQVRTRWLLSPRANPSEERRLNLLLVPFPYRVEGGSFSQRLTDKMPGAKGTFSVSPSWLRGGTSSISEPAISQFVLDLIERTKGEVGKVDGVIFPELALNEKCANSLAKTLAERSSVSLFVAGVGSSAPSKAQNYVFGAICHRKKILTSWRQSKHHRWRLDRRQICGYQLGDALDPNGALWEHLDVSGRECLFYVFRHGASLATLVCEDLARIEPVQAAIRSIGPNLLVALLMDGPQLERRWPGRYATVLAEDPGSAVLTLTSVGMIARSAMPGVSAPRSIALWKEPGGVAHELTLPKGDHALLVTLAVEREENFSLDGRSDDGTSMKLTLSGAHSVRHLEPPSWVD